MDKEFVALTELLMVQLLKLDAIEADGEAKVQRRIEVSQFCICASLLISLYYYSSSLLFVVNYFY